MDKFSLKYLQTVSVCLQIFTIPKSVQNQWQQQSKKKKTNRHEIKAVHLEYCSWKQVSACQTNYKNYHFGYNCHTICSIAKFFLRESFFLGSKGKRSKWERSKADACLRELPQQTSQQAWISGYLLSLLLSTQKGENQHICNTVLLATNNYNSIKNWKLKNQYSPRRYQRRSDRIWTYNSL